MKSKEEILNNKIVGEDVFVGENSIRLFPFDKALMAMDEYVKQEAIEFAKFVMDKTCQDLNVDGRWTLDDDCMSDVTDEQLYELYLQSKQQR